MKCIGIAVAIELEELAKTYGAKDKIIMDGYYSTFIITRDKYKIIFLQTGPGEIQAAAGTQYLISKYNPQFIVNFGVCGGLENNIKKGHICIVDELVHTDYDISMASNEKNFIKEGQYMGLSSERIYLNEKLNSMLEESFSEILHKNTFDHYSDILKRVACASQDKLIVTDENRINLGQRWKCEICDMELAGCAIIALKNRVPLVSVKLVSDSLENGMDDIEAWPLEFQRKALMFKAVMDVISRRI